MDENLERYFFEKTIPEFRQLCIVLHEVILSSHPEIKQSFKWQMPAYDYKGLMLGIGAFKHKVTLFFHRGAEMPDPAGWFVGQEANVTMRSRQFKTIEEIDDNLGLYIQNAILVAESGKLKMKKNKPKPLPPLPSELSNLLDNNPIANTFFESLSKSHKREYIVWISKAKREETKQVRLTKTLAKLLEGQTCWKKYS